MALEAKEVINTTHNIAIKGYLWHIIRHIEQLTRFSEIQQNVTFS